MLAEPYLSEHTFESDIARAATLCRGDDEHLLRIWGWLDNGADVDEAGGDAWDGEELCVLSRCEHPYLAKFLVERGADVNRADRYGATPLYHACSNPNEPWGTEMMNALLDAGATPLKMRGPRAPNAWLGALPQPRETQTRAAPLARSGGSQSMKVSPAARGARAGDSGIPTHSVVALAKRVPRDALGLSNLMTLLLIPARNVKPERLRVWWVSRVAPTALEAAILPPKICQL